MPVGAARIAEGRAARARDRNDRRIVNVGAARLGGVLDRAGAVLAHRGRQCLRDGEGIEGYFKRMWVPTAIEVDSWNRGQKGL